LDSSEPKKILILHASAGHGHEKAARALEQACLDVLPQAQVRLYDVLTLTEGIFGRGYKKTYLFLIRYLPWLWGFAYYLTDFPWVYFFLRPLRRWVNHWAARRLEERILEERPDVVIATHFLPVEVVGFLKKKKLCHARLITVITDYLAHSFWLDKEVTCYAVGSEETREDLKKRSVLLEKILVSGIPVEKKFAQAVPRALARAKLSLDAEGFTVLVTSGGAGVGTMELLAKNLLASRRPIQLLAVCGTNQKLAEHLQLFAEKKNRLHVFGFVDNIHELMAASDLVIGKGGGLTVTESLCVGKPMILFGSVPGQETRNAHSMARQGAARIANSSNDVLRFTTEMMDSPELLKEYANTALRLGHSQAAVDIVHKLIKNP